MATVDSPSQGTQKIKRGGKTVYRTPKSSAAQARREEKQKNMKENFGMKTKQSRNLTNAPKDFVPF